jgi:hypothetical protein
MSKIRSISGFVIDDSSAILYPITPATYTEIGTYNKNSVCFLVFSTYVSLYRAATGVFDNTSWDSTSFNRGWLIIGYVD